MIHIKMSSGIYNKEIFELIRAFYPEYKIIEVDEMIDEGVFINFIIENACGITDIFIDGKLRTTSKVNLETIHVHRPKDKTMRIGIKKSLFIALKKATAKELPWGILTGIRPVKIVRSLMDKRTPTHLIKHILTKEYMLDEEKANLIITIAIKQKDYIYPIDEDRYSLYIGIPFCPSRCSYCSFAALPINKYQSYVATYIDKLIHEIKTNSGLLKKKKLNTIYIGGGTPTSIPVHSLERIIKVLHEHFDVSNVKEFTIEAGRPETITEDMLKMIKLYNIDRISINPQTMKQSTLDRIGRNHRVEDIIRAYNMAKDIGFKTINMDLIVGLPGEDDKDMENTLNQIAKLNPENLTIHALAIKKGSKYGDSGDKTYLDNITTTENMMDLTKEHCKNKDYSPYYLYRQKQILGNLENIGYTKAGHESRYNIAIMEERETIIGVGAGSTTKIYNPREDSLKRIFNFKDLKSYIDRIDEVIDRKRKSLYI